jgi:hypothetical protein
VRYFWSARHRVPSSAEPVPAACCLYMKKRRSTLRRLGLALKLRGGAASP